MIYGSDRKPHPSTEARLTHHNRHPRTTEPAASGKSRSDRSRRRTAARRPSSPRRSSITSSPNAHLRAARRRPVLGDNDRSLDRRPPRRSRVVSTATDRYTAPYPAWFQHDLLQGRRRAWCEDTASLKEATRERSEVIRTALPSVAQSKQSTTTKNNNDGELQVLARL